MNAPTLTHRQRLEAAVRHQMAGRLQEAITLYQELLRIAPRDDEVMQRLGVALAQCGMHAEGARYMRSALQLNPNRPSVLLNFARALVAMGQLQEALTCAQRVLVLDAAAPGAARLAGAVLAALGRHEEALAYLGQALRADAADAGATADLGVSLAALDRSTDALACFERAVELDSNQAAAHHNIGILAARMGDHARAAGAFERALKLQPSHAALHSNFGFALKALGRLSEARQSFSTALAIDATNSEVWRNRAVVNLLLREHEEALADYDVLRQRRAERPADLIGRGAALLAMGRDAEALEPLYQAASSLPGEVDAHVQLGVALLRLERHVDAVASFDRALALKGDESAVLNNRGVALTALGRTDEALQDFIRSSALDGSVPDTHTNIGVVFKSIGDYRQAGLQFDRALSLKHDDAAARFESAFLHLTLSEFRKGWRLYEARFQVPALAIPQRDFAHPQWDGRATLTGKTLLVHAEQGLGDTIQFARYLPLLIARGATVIFEVMPSLRALMRSLSGADSGRLEIIARGDPIPAVDFHCPLLSLPLAFDTRLETIPAEVPYLAAEPTRVRAWSDRLSGIRGLRVGLAWQGSVHVERLVWARGRSWPLTALAPLTSLTGVSWVSLQKGPGLGQLRAVPFRDRIVDFSQQLDNGSDAFLDSAAIMASLDLIITSDTSIAHLAGALGRPVWLALNAAADWRWLLERADSPWYPTMRLFRQPDRTSGWDPVVADMVAALAAFLAKR